MKPALTFTLGKPALVLLAPVFAAAGALLGVGAALAWAGAALGLALWAGLVWQLWRTRGDDRFAQVFRSSPDSIAIIRESDGRFVEVNAGFETLTGFSAPEVLGRRPHERAWVHVQQRAAIAAQLARDGLVRDTPVQFRRRDGEVRDCIVNVTRAALGAADNWHCIWIARDVTLEQATHAQFVAAFHLSPDFMSISRLRDGQYVEVNEAFENLAGYQRAEVIGRTAVELGIWHDLTQRAELVNKLQTGETVRGFPMLLQTRNNGLRQALLNCSVYEARGEQYLITLLRDVTRERAAEQALRHSEAKLAALFNASPSAIVVSDARQRYAIVTANHAWERQFGYTLQESLGKNGSELGIWADSATRDAALQEVEQSNRIAGMDAWMVRRDGVQLLCHITARRVEVGEERLLIMVQDDVTTQRRDQREIIALNNGLEERVARRTEELQKSLLDLSQALQTLQMAQNQLVHAEKLAALGALVAGVAHELNTPIGNGLTVASTMEHRVQEFAKRMPQGLRRSELEQFVTDAGFATEILVRNLTRAGTLVSSFKQLAVDQASSQRRAFALQEIVSEVLLTLNPAIRQSGCSVVTDVSGQLWLDSYPGPLGQALTNLINNAMLHGYAAAPGQIEIVAQAYAGQQIELMVRDHGQGIAPDNLKKIYDPFFTTRLGQGGSGLGLHIVHNIVVAVLGGAIEVVSQPGMGAAFVLRFPRVAPQGSVSPDSIY